MNAKVSADEHVTVPVSILARMVEALDRIDARASAAPAKPYGVTEQIADQQEAARARMRPWVIVYPGVESRITLSKFDIEIQSTDRHPNGCIRALPNFRVSEVRRREIYTGIIGGQERAIQAALIRQRYPEEEGDADGLDAAVDGIDRLHVASMDREYSRTLRTEVWRSLFLPDLQGLVGRPISETRHLLGPLPKYVVVDHDDRWVHPLPPQE